MRLGCLSDVVPLCSPREGQRLGGDRLGKSRASRGAGRLLVLPDEVQRRDAAGVLRVIQSTVDSGAMKARMTWIYALCEPDTMEPRYVGKTCNAMCDRHTAHLRAAKRPRLPVHRWLSSLDRDGKGSAIKALELVAADGDWAAREKFWIRNFREAGIPLLNLTEGGEGLAGLPRSQEHREKIAAGLRTGKRFDCEVCGATFWRKQFAIKKGDCRFCSRACYQNSLRGVSKPVPPQCKSAGVAAAAAAKLAKTECKRGHEFTPENTRLNGRGARVCKTCTREYKRVRRHG